MSAERSTGTDNELATDDLGAPPWTGLTRRLSFIWSGRTSGVLLILAIGVVWQFSAITGLVASPFFPPVTDIVWTWGELLLQGTLGLELVASLRRMFIGYVAAASVGVAVGVLMGYFRPVYNLLEPLVEILRPVPSPAYIPMVILFLGIGDSMKIFMVFLASLFPILLNTYSGVRSVDRVQIDTGRTFGLRSHEVLRDIILPASSPYIMAGLRVSLAIALILTIIAEMVAANNGIGYFILNTQRAFRVTSMYAGVLTLAAVGYLLNRLFLVFEGRILRWHTESSGRAGS